MKTYVRANLALCGLHRWPEAPDNRAYLREPHRHEFRISGLVCIDHARQVEFHDLQDMIASAFGPPSRLYDFGTLSCEAIAREVWDHLRTHQLDVAEVVVSEDGENEAVLR